LIFSDKDKKKQLNPRKWIAYFLKKISENTQKLIGCDIYQD